MLWEGCYKVFINAKSYCNTDRGVSRAPYVEAVWTRWQWHSERRRVSHRWTARSSAAINVTWLSQPFGDHDATSWWINQNYNGLEAIAPSLQLCTYEPRGPSSHRSKTSRQTRFDFGLVHAYVNWDTKKLASNWHWQQKCKDIQIISWCI